MSTTTNLADFGAREKETAEHLLKAMRVSGLPADFNDDGVEVMFNTMSGNVFLTNSDFQVAMLVDEENSDELASFYNSPYEGKEGFFSDLKDEYKEMHPEDQEWFRQLNDDYYNEALPIKTDDGVWIDEGEEFFTLELNNLVSNTLDETTDDSDGISRFSTEIAAWKAISDDNDTGLNYEAFTNDEEFIEAVKERLTA